MPSCETLLRKTTDDDVADNDTADDDEDDDDDSDDDETSPKPCLSKSKIARREQALWLSVLSVSDESTEGVHPRSLGVHC